MANGETIQDDEKEFETTDQGLAAFLATRFMFLAAVDTGQKIGRGHYGTKKSFVFLVPADVDMDVLTYEYREGLLDDCPQPVVMFNKMRLMRQACKQPFTAPKIGVSK